MTEGSTTRRHSMPIGMFLEHFRPVYPVAEDGSTSWEATIKLLEDSPPDSDLMNRLSAILSTDGKFRDPVRVAYDDDEEEGGYWYVADGTHRTATWVKSGATFIEFTEDYPRPEIESSLWFETTFSIAHATGKSLSPEEREDALFDILPAAASRYTSAGEWVTIGLASCANGVAEVVWDSLPSSTAPGIEERLAEVLRDALSEHGYVLEGVVTTQIFDEEDED